MKNFFKFIFVIIFIILIIFIFENMFIKKHKEDVDLVETTSNEAKINSTQNSKEIEKDEYNVLVIGNSLTIERDGIGMAASDQYHDYYYYTKTEFEKKYKTVNMDRISAIDWEENRKITSRTDWIAQNITEKNSANKDLIIFQLGDNCVPTETFRDSIIELVNHVKKYSPNAEMILMGMWFINEERLNMMPDIAKELNMIFVDISDLVVDENKSFIGQKIIAIDGTEDQISTIEEAFHPNDIGMKKISDKIIKALEKQ